ncbi:ribosome recycling factor [Blastomyces silverae]|uniref:Ribosome recycling factor n=1 Tax=Blastomyces silverae TaxID=2060906 RepID=A0A0H1BIG4_9EURO|nr:ribosome recycling factor [Blastomyces silverae]
MSPVIRSFSSEAFSLLSFRTTSTNGSLRALAVPMSSRSSVITSGKSAFQSSFYNNPLTLPRTTAPGFRVQPFSTTSHLSKKKDKGNKASRTSDSGSGSGAAEGAGLDGDDPFGFTQLENDIAGAVQRLKDDISKLRAGGRFNPEAIETLRVAVSMGDGKGSKETVKLGELAQVIPKGGRMLTILVGEEDYIKPITSSLLSSNLSLNPQPDPHNSLQLNVPIPPPTKESRDQSVKDAKAAMDKASTAVRNARGAINKKLKNMGVKKLVRPDDLHKQVEKMEKIAEKGQKEVKDVFEGAKKALEA